MVQSSYLAWSDLTVVSLPLNLLLVERISAFNFQLRLARMAIDAADSSQNKEVVLLSIRNLIDGTWTTGVRGREFALLQMYLAIYALWFFLGYAISRYFPPL